CFVETGEFSAAFNNDCGTALASLEERDLPEKFAALQRARLSHPPEVAAAPLRREGWRLTLPAIVFPRPDLKLAAQNNVKFIAIIANAADCVPFFVGQFDKQLVYRREFFGVERAEKGNAGKKFVPIGHAVTYLSC